MKRTQLVVVFIAGLTLSACRGTESGRTPIHINPNMDFQEKFDPQEPNRFFADQRAMRMPVAGTVARGFLGEDTRFNAGREKNGTYVTTIPVPLTMEFMKRGQERFNIYCAVCHGKAGDGQGIIMTGGYSYTPAPTYHDDRLRTVEDGYLYEVITNGIRTMPPYGPQITVMDRWAIVAYVRALQRSQGASLQDVPADQRGRLQPSTARPDTTRPAGSTGAADTTSSR